MLQLQKLERKWVLENVLKFNPIDVDTLEIFQNDHNVVLPDDFQDYFKLLNGTSGEYTDDLFEFYSIDRIKRFSDEFKDWEGIPNYQALLNLQEVKGLFVFANYSFNLFAYAIRLYPEEIDRNEVYVLCGEDYKRISDSFSGFIDLYLNESIELYLNKEKD